MRTVLTGGGTAGHICPALAVAASIQARSGDQVVAFVGSTNGMEAQLVPAAGLQFVGIPARKLHRLLAPSTPLVFGSLARGFVRARHVLGELRPDVVLGTGGYVAAATVLAARARGIPTVIHEQNAVAGRTNLWLARWATRVCVSFIGTESQFRGRHVDCTGMPIRSSIVGDRPAAECRAALGLHPERPTILVLGGSQGAAFLNGVVLQTLAMLPAEAQVIHQVGRAHEVAVREAAGCLQHVACGYQSTGFMDEATLAQAMGAATVAVTRCGASTLAELTANGIPAIMVPYPAAYADHQTHNAQALVSRGAGLIIPQNALTPSSLAEHLREMLSSETRLREMATASRCMSRPEAAKAVADVMLEAAGGKV